MALRALYFQGVETRALPTRGQPDCQLAPPYLDDARSAPHVVRKRILWIRLLLLYCFVVTRNLTQTTCDVFCYVIVNTGEAYTAVRKATPRAALNQNV